MKRIIYIILAATLILATLGGVTALADYNAESLTRGTTYLAAEATSESVDAPTLDGDAKPAPDVESDANTLPDVESDANTAPDVESDANTAPDVESDANTLPDVESDAKPTPEIESDASDEKSTAQNPFAAFFGTVKEYATEIFCSLTFVGSILLALAYKKGLIPLLQGGISAISGTVSRIKESAERGESKTDELSRVVCDRLNDAEVCLDGIEQTLGGLEQRLNELDDCERQTKAMRLVMSAQVDMLYSIFMTSSLPQYQKDEVGERIKEMKEALLADDGE